MEFKNNRDIISNNSRPERQAWREIIDRQHFGMLDSEADVDFAFAIMDYSSSERRTRLLIQNPK